MPPSQTTPVVLIISPNSPDSDLIRTTVNQLLEQRILFKGYFEQDILHGIPDDLEDYPAVLLGNRMLKTATPAEKARLEAYAKKHVLFVLNDCRWPGNRHPVYIDEPYAEIDSQPILNAFGAAAGVGNQDLPPLPQKTVIRGITDRILDLFASFRKIAEVGEYHHHILHAALAIENSPYNIPGLTAEINAFLEHVFSRPRDLFGGDSAIALSFAPVYAERLRVDSFREKFEQSLSQFIDTRCRTPQGHLAIAGIKDDPLSLRAFPDAAQINGYSHTNSMRAVSLNDMLTCFELLAAGTSFTGNPRFFDEAWKVFTYLRDVHQDKDGLFFYASRDGKPIAGKWARGQGHALCGMYHMLIHYPGMPAERRNAILECIDRVGHGLAAVQRNDGRWSNVLDHEYVRTETSSTVLFTYVFASVCNRGWLDAAFYKPMLERARKAILTRAWRGLFSGNCRGTFASFYNPAYLDFRDQHMCIMPYAAPGLIESAKLLWLEEMAGKPFSPCQYAN